LLPYRPGGGGAGASATSGASGTSVHIGGPLSDSVVSAAVHPGQHEQVRIGVLERRELLIGDRAHHRMSSLVAGQRCDLEDGLERRHGVTPRPFRWPLYPCARLGGVADSG
jgi:hypothetical protein